MRCWELAKGSNFVTFTEVDGPQGDRIDVAEWYGYDIRNARRMTREGARRRWRELRAEGPWGGYALERSMNVGAGFLGIDRG